TSSPTHSAWPSACRPRSSNAGCAACARRWRTTTSTAGRACCSPRRANWWRSLMGRRWFLKVTGRLASARRTRGPLALLFDYDGTLTPIVERPSLALLEPCTRALLGRLAQTAGVSVGIISGRNLTDLRHLVGLPGLYYAGTGGLELDLKGTRLTHPR